MGLLYPTVVKVPLLKRHYLGLESPRMACIHG